MKKANNQYLHTFWMAGGILMKFPGKMQLMIILKSYKKARLHSLSLRTIHFFENHSGGQTEGWNHDNPYHVEYMLYLI